MSAREQAEVVAIQLQEASQRGGVASAGAVDQTLRVLARVQHGGVLPEKRRLLREKCHAPGGKKTTSLRHPHRKVVNLQGSSRKSRTGRPALIANRLD